MRLGGSGLRYLAMGLAEDSLAQSDHPRVGVPFKPKTAKQDCFRAKQDGFSRKGYQTMQTANLMRKVSWRTIDP
jgi:hypothetical protein